MYQDILQIYNTLSAGNISQHLVDQPLERGGSIAEAKWEDLKLPQTSIGDEGSFGSGSGARATCQYLLRRSSQENQEDPATESRASSMSGRG